MSTYAAILVPPVELFLIRGTLTQNGIWKWGWGTIFSSYMDGLVGQGKSRRGKGATPGAQHLGTMGAKCPIMPNPPCTKNHPPQMPMEMPVENR